MYNFCGENDMLLLKDIKLLLMKEKINYVHEWEELNFVKKMTFSKSISKYCAKQPKIPTWFFVGWQAKPKIYMEKIKSLRIIKTILK